MTPAQKSRLIGFNASLTQRGVSVTVVPDGVEVLALVEEVTEKSRQRLQIQDDLTSHCIHIRRDLLAVAVDASNENITVDGGRPDASVTKVDLDKISEITRADSEQTYRVQHYRDDAQRPAVLFFCILK